MQSRRTLVIVVVSLVVICLCLAAIGALGYSLFSIRGSATASAPTPIEEAVTVEPPATAVEATETVPPDPDPTATGEADESIEPTEPSGAAGENLPPEIAAQMDDIQQQVIGLRGLDTSGEFTRAIYSPEELRERVINDFFSDYTPEEAADDALILALLGLVEPGYDLLQLYIDLYSDSVAGFYDDETHEMVVVGGDDFTFPERLTYAHEFNHALQDQNFDFDEGMGYNDDDCEIDSERCAAIQALIEGDASLLEVHWFQTYATPEDMQEYLDYANSVDLSTFDSAPAYLQEDFIFPYNEGYLFVEALYQGGGWENIDLAFRNPPVSTEQILHPELYPGEVPDAVSLPDLTGPLGDGWELLDDNVMGEWYTYLILAHGADPGARLPEEQAAEAAAGWGGDRYAVYINRETGGLVLVLKATWDSPADTLEFTDAFGDYGSARFGAGSATTTGATLYESDQGVFLFAEVGGTTIWIAAPDPATAEMVLEAVN